MEREFNRAELERYILNELDEDRRGQLRDALLESADLDAQVQDVENDLIDADARDALPIGRREALRAYLETTDQLHRVGFARALAAKRAPQSRVRIWAAAALLIVAAGLTWMYRSNAPEPIRVAENRAPELSLKLYGGVTRGAASGRSLAIPPDVKTIDLEIEMPAEDADGYRLEIVSPQGSATFTKENRPWPPSPLRLKIPASAFATGTVTVRLSTLRGNAPEPIAFHDIRITHQ